MGRRRHEPSEETRLKVNTLSMFGVKEVEIAGHLNIDPKTLRKYYRSELSDGHLKANVSVAKSLYRQAIDGNVTAAIFWLKSRAGWSEKQETEGRNDTQPLEIKFSVKEPVSEIQTTNASDS